MAEAVAEDYRSSLSELNFNSKPHINMLTMLAEDNIEHAKVIVDSIIFHIKSVPPELKLPSLYLVDSIMKNVSGRYIELFCPHLVTVFSSVFEKVEEMTRSALFKLRQTWSQVLPNHILNGIDITVNRLDPAWPITAHVPKPPVSPRIHINPKFVAPPQVQKQQPMPKLPPSVLREEVVMPAIKNFQRNHDEVLWQVEQKKLQLKALEQRKLEMVARQKQSALQAIPAVPQQTVNPSFASQHDPRLKRQVPVGTVAPDISSTETTNTTVLQSVVIVPTATPPPEPQIELSKIPMPEKPPPVQENSRKNGKVTESPEDPPQVSKPEPPKTENSKNLVKGKPFRIPKVEDKLKVSPKESKSPPRRESLGRSCKSLSRKRSISPGKQRKSDSQSPKRVFKSTNTTQKGKRTRTGESSEKKENGLSVEDRHEPKKSPVKPGAGKRPTFRSTKDSKKSPPKNSESKDYVIPKKNSVAGRRDGNEKTDGKRDEPSDERSTDSSLFGPEDKDYRQNSLTSLANEKPLPPVFIHSTRNDSLLSREYTTSDTQRRSSPVMRPGDSFLENSRIYVPTATAKEYGYSSVPESSKYMQPVSKTFKLDGKDRTINFVNQRAFLLLDNNEPRELSFIGPPRKVFIDGHVLPSPLGFEGMKLNFDTGGKLNTIQFCAPSREVYINSRPYEAQFGGPPFYAVLEDGKEHQIRIDGPPPQVIVGDKPAFELHDLFIRSRTTTSEFGLNKPLDSGNIVQDVDMRVKGNAILPPPPQFEPHHQKDVDWRQPPTLNQMRPPAPVAPLQPPPGIPVFDNLLPAKSPPHTWELQPPPMPPASLGNLSFRPPAPLLPKPTTVAPSVTMPMPNQWGGGSFMPPPRFEPPIVSNPGGFAIAGTDLVVPSTLATIVPTSLPQAAPIPVSPVNVNTIYAKLVAAGMINTAKKVLEEPKEEPLPEPEPEEKAESPIREESPEKEIPEKEETPFIPDIRLTPKCLRTYLPGVITLLYKGTQCATCGMRFKEIQSEQYKQHLDWHFRMNRREKDGAKKAFSRRLFFVMKDWIEFSEIEELEERMPSYFELQADTGSLRNAENEKICSVPASECDSERCAVCGEQFQLFWVEEEEEWHLKHAVRHDGEVYHPPCYEDFKKATKSPEPQPPEEEKPEEPTEEEVAIKEEPLDDFITVKEEAATEKDSKADVLMEEVKTEEDVKPTIKTDPDGTETEEVKMEVEVKEEVEEEERPKKKKRRVRESLDSDSDEEVEEFRPPTPDPRFEVLPPVLRGTELSALCSIM